MIQGWGTMGSVALQIARDFDGGDRLNGYSYAQAVNRIIMEEESVSGLWDNQPSYVWWHLGIEEGEIVPVLDLEEEQVLSEEGVYNWLMEMKTDSGPWAAIGYDTISQYSKEHTPLSFMLEHGLSFGQKVLSRTVGSFSKDYWGEHDMNYEGEIIYVREIGAIDIPVQFDNFARRPQFTRLSIQC